MMQHKVVMYPMYEETLVVTGLRFDGIDNGVDYTKHYTLKTTHAPRWRLSDLLRELADRIDSQDA
jgi:hypothetical protein